MNDNIRNTPGETIKQHGILLSLTLQGLAAQPGVSASHLGRMERGERFSSAHILPKIAKPLGFEKDELFTLAGYLFPRCPVLVEKELTCSIERLDPYAAKVLAQEPAEMQRAVIGTFAILKSIAKGMSKEGI